MLLITTSRISAISWRKWRRSVSRCFATGCWQQSREQEELQIAVLSALSAVHGLTMMSIDGLATVPRLTAEKIAEKMVETLCNGLLRRSTQL
jgi:hypothetical protein